jgi:ATP-dependent Clp protease ATP-binding subunit ClpB
MREAVMQSLNTRFLPEFLNRIDEILIFHPLKRPEIRKIVEIQVGRLKRQLQEKGIELEVTPAAVDTIAAEGYDPTYGARPLKRLIQQRIQNPLSVEILKREFAEGSRVKIDCVEGEFTFERIE